MLAARAQVRPIGPFPSEGQRAFAALGDKRIVIASVLGVSVPYVCQLMSGIRRPHYDLMRKMEKKLGIDIHSWGVDGQDAD